MKFGKKIMEASSWSGYIPVLIYEIWRKTIMHVIFDVNKCTRRKSHYNFNHNPQYN